MIDRVPLYPGRVKLTPVSGQANTYDMVRADSPTQEGTPLNKASLLKDATAALYGLAASAVPDDLLSVLSKSVLAQVSAKYTKHVGTYADLPAGSPVTLNVGGTPYEFIVVQQGKPSSMYDDSCSGTWLLMKNIYENRQWNNSSSVNDYGNSTIHSYLNSTFLNLFDSNIQSELKQVKIPYGKKGDYGTITVQSGANGLSCKVFLLSGYEVGWTTGNSSYFPVDGAKLAYFENGTSTSANNKRIATLNGSAANWGLRSPNTDSSSSNVWVVNSSGANNTQNSFNSLGVRPCIILPSDGEYVYYTDAEGNVYSEQEVETQLTDVLGNLIQIPASQIKDGVKMEVVSYTGTGTYGLSNPNVVSFSFAPDYVLGLFYTIPNRSDYAFPRPMGNTGFSCAVIMSDLTTSSKAYQGLVKSNDEKSFAKKSADGKTLKWYSTSSANEQNNNASDGGNKYYVLGLKL